MSRRRAGLSILESRTVCTCIILLSYSPNPFPIEHHLYTLVSSHLKAHPTTEASPALLRIPHMPPPDPENPNPPPAIPKGWKMNTILPLHSPAVSGGGISENFLQEMMAEMQGGGQGQGMPRLENGGGAPAKKKKKDKAKK
jgi:signal recognition particle subunit SRP19